jgi:hypothetical protein
VELRGPSIEQVVHPLAAAELSSGQAGGTGRGKRIISSCSGSFVDVGVDLRVSDFLTNVNRSRTLCYSGHRTVEYRDSDNRTQEFRNSADIWYHNSS